MKAFVSIGLIAIVGLSGCAQMVTKRYGANKGGTVKYSKELLMTEKNRAKAMEQADEFCRPSRAIVTSEEDRSEFTGKTVYSAQRKGNRAYGESQQQKSSHVYVNFRCAKGGKSVAHYN